MTSDPRALPVPALWKAPIELWAVELAACALSRATIATRTDHLRRLARAVGGDPWLLSGSVLVGWAGAQVWSRETRRSVYASLRSFYDWALRHGLVEVSPAAVLPRVKPAPPLARPAGDDALAIATRLADPRTLLILRLADEAGLRRAEIAQVALTDLSRHEGRWVVLVHGKGGHDRLVPIGQGLAVMVRQACLAGGGWCFPGDAGGHLSPRWVGKLATRVLPGDVTLHMLRHRFATRCYAATNDLMGVSLLLGHVSVATTQRYLQISPERLRRVVEAVA